MLNLPIQTDVSDSETTIYQRVVPMETDDDCADMVEQMVGNQQTVKRISTSSEDDCSSSIDHEITFKKGALSSGQKEICYDERQLNYETFVDHHLKEQRSEMEMEQLEPSTSRGGGRSEKRHLPSPPPTPAEIAEKKTREMIRRAKAAKAKMLDAPGRNEFDCVQFCGQGVRLNPSDNGGNNSRSMENNVFSRSDLFHSVIVNEGYSVVGRHLEPALKKRIIDGKFVDFARLLPRDRVLSQQDNQLEMFINNGQPGFRSVSESETIGSFYKWEQAFRVYSTVMADAYPEKVKQMIQYNHIIYSASLSYLWSNVYAYDIDFRLHMAENPGHNWGIILHQAWVLHMKERLTSSSGGGNSTNQKGGNYNSNVSNNLSAKKGKNCWKYNRGKCTYGFNCKFEHRCGICNKFGHSAHLC